MSDDIENEEADLEIEVLEEGEAPAQEEQVEEKTEEQVEEEELANVSERVQKRISKLTAQKHEEARRAAQAERDREEALKIAEHAVQQMRQREALLAKYEGGMVTEAKGRVEVELEAAKAAFKAAFETGDADGMANAQDRIARLAPQHEQFSRYKPREPEAYEPPPPPQPQPQARPETDQNLQAFIQENPWFNTDEDMTAYAFGLHQRLAASDPGSVGTPEYYETIAERTKTAFAHKMKPQAPARRESPVSPVSRAPGAPARKQVRLTPNQLRIAQRLGLTPQQYAEAVLEQEKAR